MAKEEKKRPIFTISRLVMALAFFVAFLVIGIGGDYYAAGELMSGELAAIYALLALLGALGVFFRLRRFSFLYYTGCIMGWGAGWFVAGLRGSFAPTAGTITTFFLIGVFALVGMLEQIRSFRVKRAKRKAEAEKAAALAEEERQQLELKAAEAEKEAARRAEEEARQAALSAAQAEREAALGVLEEIGQGQGQ